MKFYVKCYNCGNVFAVNVQRYGVSKYRCPECSNLVPFLLVQSGLNGVAYPVVFPQPVKVPRTNSNGVMVKGVPQPLTIDNSSSTDVPHPSVVAVQSTSVTTPRTGFWIRLGHAFLWFFRLLARFFRWSAKKIRTFRETYEDADLWLFFFFSVLFIVIVIIGLLVMAQITILLSDGHSWLFQMFLKLKFMF